MIPTRLELVRTNTETGAVLRQGFADLRPPKLLADARRRVAWCGTDNLGMSRVQASVAAQQVTVLDKPFVLGHYRFEWVQR